MPAKAAKAHAVKQTLTDRLDALFEQGDPLLAAAMLLGGTAAASGVTPPLCRLLNLQGGSSSDLDKLAETAIAFAGGIVPGMLFTGFLFGQSGSSTTAQPGAKEYTAMFCEGAVEVYLMSKLFGNPEFLKGIMGAASSGLGLLKGVAATAL